MHHAPPAPLSKWFVYNERGTRGNGLIIILIIIIIIVGLFE